MPIYEYVCSACGAADEFLQRLSDPAPEQCPACKAPGTLTKALGATRAIFKGPGWAKDGYSKPAPETVSSSPPSQMID